MSRNPLFYFQGSSGYAKVIEKAGTPGSSDVNHPLGTICVDTTNDLPYFLVDKASGSATWVTSSGVTTLAALTDVTITSASSAQMLIFNTTWKNYTLTGDIAVGATGIVSISADSIVNADIKTTAAIAFSKLAALTTGSILIGVGNVATILDVKGNGKILVGNGTTATSVAVSGDCTLANDGSMEVTNITVGSDAQGDIYFQGAAGLERLAAGTAGQALVTAGAASDPYWGTPSVAGATSIANLATLNDAGANDAILSFTTQTVGAPTLTVPDFASVSDTFAFVTLAQTFANKTLTAPDINGGTADSLTGFSLRSSGAAFDLEFDTAEVLTAGHKISWDVGDADRTVTLGGNIALGGTLTTLGSWTHVGAHTLQVTTTGATTITLPTTGTLATVEGAETLTNKTLTTPKIVTTGSITDAGGDEYVQFVESATPVNHIVITQGDTGVSPMITSGGEANIPLMLHANGTGNVQITDGGDITAKIEFELDGATTGKTMTLTHSHTDDRALTFPDATDTLVGKATSDTFTNKSYDCDGTGNVLTNVNMDEMQAQTIPAADGNNVTIVDGLIMAKVSNNATNFNIFNANAPYAFMIIDAWSMNISADGGTWKLNSGAAGAGTDLTDVVTVAASDKDIDRVTQIDDAAAQIAASGSLSIVFDGGGALDAYIFIKIARLA